MEKNQETYHYPVELRDVAYRIATANGQVAVENNRRKALALLLLKQSTVLGLLDAVDVVPKAEDREPIRAKVLSLAAAYNGEAAAMYAEFVNAQLRDDEEVPF